MQCYVCLEEGGEFVRDACGCRDAAVHTACLRQWIAHSQRTQCAMCGWEYAGVVHRETPTPTCRAVLQVVIFGTFAGFMWFVVDVLTRTRQGACVECILAEGAAIATIAWMYAVSARQVHVDRHVRIVVEVPPPIRV